MVVTLCACASEEETAAQQTSPTEDGSYVTEFEGPTPMDEASMLVGEDVEQLLLLVGAPERIEFYPSAINEGDEVTIEEGMYFYSDFVVYTLKEGNSEIIYSVEYLGSTQ